MPSLGAHVRVVREGGAWFVPLHCLGVDIVFWDFALCRHGLPGHGSSRVPAGSRTKTTK
jgi:hypothetical protein